MQQHPTRTSITRRRLFGIGAATGAAVATGSTATAFAAPGPDDSVGAGFSQNDAARPETVTPAAILPGASVLAVGYSSFQAISFTAGASIVYSSPAAVALAGQPGHLHAPIPLPAGTRILRVDVVGWRVTTGFQTWNLYKTNLQANAGLTSIGSVNTNTVSSGEVQAGIAFTPPLLIAPGESLHIELVGATVENFNRAVGALVQYMPAATSLTPITPKRVYDSRFGTAGKIVKGTPRLVSVATEYNTANGVVPAGARAIAYNLTATDTESGYGYLAIVPGGDPNSGVSSINWDKAQATIANGLIVGLNANREVSVYCDGTGTTKTHFVIDIVGYFL